MLNTCQFIGRLVRDPELNIANSGTQVCKFTMAVDTGYGENKATEFVRFTCFGKTAENVSKFLTKGKLAYAEGRLQIGSYEKDGVRHTTVDIIANRVLFLSGKSDAPAEVKAEPTLDEYPQDWSTDQDLPF